MTRSRRHILFAMVPDGANALLVAATALLLTSCALVAPASREEFVLVTLNGSPVPAPLWQGPGPDGRMGETRIVSARLALFGNGRFAWDVEKVELLDGQPDPDFPETSGRIVGPYSVTDTAIVLSWIFRANFSGDSLVVNDVSGTLRGARFVYVRAD